MTEKAQKLQVDKFRDAARELGTDDDPKRFAETVRKLAQAKPVPQGITAKIKKGEPGEPQ